MEKYCYSTDGETFHGSYDSREKAIEQAEDDLIMDVAECFLRPNQDCQIQTARCFEYEPKITTWAVEKLVEDVSDEVYETCGIDDYMCELSKEQLKDLTEKLNQTFKDWVTVNYNRHVWYADDIQKHVIHI